MNLFIFKTLPDGISCLNLYIFDLDCNAPLDPDAQINNPASHQGREKKHAIYVVNPNAIENLMGIKKTESEPKGLINLIRMGQRPIYSAPFIL